MASGVKHAWKRRVWVRVPGRGAKAKGHISNRIHGDAAHPTVNPVCKTRGIRALLENDRVTIWITQFPPPNA